MKNRCLLLCFWLGMQLSAVAQTGLPPVFSIRPDSVQTPDTTHIQVLEDARGELTFEQVRQSSAFRVEPFFDPTRRAHVYWLRMRLRNTGSDTLNLYLGDFSSNYLDIYWLNSRNQWQHQRTGELVPLSQVPSRNGNKERNRLFFSLAPGQTTTLYQRSENAFWRPPLTYLSTQLQSEESRIRAVFNYIRVEKEWKNYFFDGIMIGILLLAVCYNLLIFFSIKDRVYLHFAICLFFFTLDRNAFWIQQAFFEEYPYVFNVLSHFFFLIFFIFFTQSIRKFIQPVPAFPRLNKAIGGFLLVTSLFIVVLFFSFNKVWFPLNEADVLINILIRVVYGLCIILILKMMKTGSVDARLALLANVPLFIFWLFTLSTLVAGQYFNADMLKSLGRTFGYLESICFAWLIIVFSGALINRYNLTKQRLAQQIIEKEQLERERELERSRLIEEQKIVLEQQVEERTAQLKASLEDLRMTQDQLVQKEKMASLGELTAGIAHEIQNPLNFVNNFSEVSIELLDELKEGPLQQLPDSEKEYAGEILGDLTQNLEKITHHGNRASSIVKGMLAHSRTADGERRPTDLNALADEFMRLSYHGLRAKDKTFNCELATQFIPNLPLVTVVTQDIGRVLLNLFNNAFYAVSEKKKQLDAVGETGYKPTVSISTKQVGKTVEIRVTDNGTGIPEAVKTKIFQPFFTTKPAGSGTGLGLSLSYDIVTKGHGGLLTVESDSTTGTAFTLALPVDRDSE
ncbi:sensor histidine kinase [Spirosoma linguale]|uniref:histidine kinase n=1 Tax=Spirosoma linguale (strain ATCC 33905 / DSM 74 / LMG 10896 / Claus 1) TaxID=504472 RepID=D2QR34_SPILD|nr:histidine kinase [Spirosoma linguale DSM 74]